MDAREEQRSLADCPLPSPSTLGRRYVRYDGMIVKYYGDGPLIQAVYEPYSPTTPTFSRELFAPLLRVHREAVQKYGRKAERIRCVKCGARKIPQALDSHGRCQVCEDADQESDRLAAIAWNRYCMSNEGAKREWKYGALIGGCRGA